MTSCDFLLNNLHEHQPLEWTTFVCFTSQLHSVCLPGPPHEDTSSFTWWIVDAMLQLLPSLFYLVSYPNQSLKPLLNNHNKSQSLHPRYSFYFYSCFIILGKVRDGRLHNPRGYGAQGSEILFISTSLPNESTLLFCYVCYDTCNDNYLLGRLDLGCTTQMTQVLSGGIRGDLNTSDKIRDKNMSAARGTIISLSAAMLNPAQWTLVYQERHATKQTVMSEHFNCQ